MAQIIETVDTPDGKMHGVILTDNELHFFRLIVGQMDSEHADRFLPQCWEQLRYHDECRDSKFRLVEPVPAFTIRLI